MDLSRASMSVGLRVVAKVEPMAAMTVDWRVGPMAGMRAAMKAVTMVALMVARTAG